MYYENECLAFIFYFFYLFQLQHFGSTTNYCNFYPFSVYKCQCQQFYNITVKTIYCKTCYM